MAQGNLLPHQLQRIKRGFVPVVGDEKHAGMYRLPGIYKDELAVADDVLTTRRVLELLAEAGVPNEKGRILIEDSNYSFRDTPGSHKKNNDILHLPGPGLQPRY